MTLILLFALLPLVMPTVLGMNHTRSCAEVPVNSSSCLMYKTESSEKCWFTSRNVSDIKANKGVWKLFFKPSKGFRQLEVNVVTSLNKTIIRIFCNKRYLREPILYTLRLKHNDWWQLSVVNTEYKTKMTPPKDADEFRVFFVAIGPFMWSETCKLRNMTEMRLRDQPLAINGVIAASVASVVMIIIVSMILWVKKTGGCRRREAPDGNEVRLQMPTRPPPPTPVTQDNTGNRCDLTQGTDLTEHIYEEIQDFFIPEDGPTSQRGQDHTVPQPGQGEVDMAQQDSYTSFNNIYVPFTG